MLKVGLTSFVRVSLSFVRVSVLLDGGLCSCAKGLPKVWEGMLWVCTRQQASGMSQRSMGRMASSLSSSERTGRCQGGGGLGALCPSGSVESVCLDRLTPDRRRGCLLVSQWPFSRVGRHGGILFGKATLVVGQGASALFTVMCTNTTLKVALLTSLGRTGHA